MLARHAERRPECRDLDRSPTRDDRADGGIHLAGWSGSTRQVPLERACEHRDALFDVLHTENTVDEGIDVTPDFAERNAVVGELDRRNAEHRVGSPGLESHAEELMRRSRTEKQRTRHRSNRDWRSAR